MSEHLISTLEKTILVSIPLWVTWWASVFNKTPCSLMLIIPRAQSLLTFMSGFPRAFWCSRGKNIRSPYAASRDQIHHRLWFCCDSFFTCIFSCSFRHHFRTIGGTEMVNVEQTQKIMPFITCEMSMCQYVCELVLGVNVFDLEFGVQMIRSNNQSRATLWVLETCFIVRLLPFVIILITASLSSKIFNRTSLREEFTFEGIKSTLSKLLITPWDCFRFWMVWGVERTSRLFINGSPRSSWPWFVFPRTATIRSHKSSAGIPSNLYPASKEMISDSVELCETEVCFLHIQLIDTNVWLPKVHNVPPVVDFESSWSPAKSESWNSPSLHCLAVFPDSTVCIHMYDECERSNEIIVCNRLWSILWLPLQVCSPSTECLVFQLMPRKSISIQFVSMLLTILRRISILLLWSGGHRCME